MADTALHRTPSQSSPSPVTAAPPSRSSTPVLPHHKLIAWQVARDFLVAVRSCSIRSTHLRDQALRAAQSAALNCAEGAGRVSRADKARAFAIARAECVEATAAVEIAAFSGEVGEARLAEVLRLADRLVALLTGLVVR
ncbi:MAG: four helix bundle protein [Deltaproteobacteria bacterium]|nr:four helix bundle protein [Deltaproteobacteria bacterium]